MVIKLWTADYVRICIANLLLFVSLYILLPVLSLEMSTRLGVPVAHTGVIFLFFALGMFLIGPFHAYLVDAYKRKFVCIFSFATMIAVTVGYAFVTNMTELILLSTVQGVAFGMVTTAGITVAIDITNTALRSPGNLNFAWMARLGMIAGIALGTWLYQVYGFKDVLYVSVVSGAAGILMLLGIYVPFRAPIVTRLYSFDRFLLLRGWVPAINLIMITFIPGLLISMVHPSANDSMLGEIPLFVGVGVGFVFSLVLSRLLQLLFQYLSFKESALRIVIIGLGLETISMTLLNIDSSIFVSSIILGLGLGLVMPEFLLMFVKLSQHCQRGTANTTHLLASEIGIVLGIVAACHIDTENLLYTGRIVASLAFLFFVLITYPYYRKMKVRQESI